MSTLQIKGRPKRVAKNMATVLQYLYENGPFRDEKTGLATTKLGELVDIPLSSSSRSVLDGLVNEGFVTIERRGKRTYSIALGPNKPEDWEPIVRQAPVAPPEPLTEAPPVPSTGEAPEAVTELPEDETVILGARPGRLAARIEREVPAIVNKAVHEAVNNIFNDMLSRLGFNNSDNSRLQEIIDDQTVALEEARKTLHRIMEELRVEKQMHEHTRAELNKYRARDDDLVPLTAGLTPNQVHENVRDLVRDANKAGWTVTRTKGGHLRFQGPNPGQLYFTASTPGDKRGPQNARSDMERMGLPK